MAFKYSNNKQLPDVSYPNQDWFSFLGSQKIEKQLQSNESKPRPSIYETVHKVQNRQPNISSPNIIMDFLIGGIAGGGATIFTNPMDVVKTRLQLQGELTARDQVKKQYRNLFHAAYVICKTDGAFALQKGLVPAVLLGFVLNSVRLGLFRVSELQQWTRDSAGKVSFYKTAFWATFSGYLSGLATNPIYVVKTRIQAASHPSIAVGRQHVYNGMADAFRTIYRTDGLRGFYAGLNATGWRMSVGSCVQLTTFSSAKEAMLRQGWLSQSPVTLAFCASCVSGVALAVLGTPLDSTCTRLYNQGSQKLLYNSIFDAVTKIWHTEGLHGFYKGVGPYYCRAAPQTTISLIIWDFLNNLSHGVRNKS